jgi:probable rRNA maturation factor
MTAPTPKPNVVISSSQHAVRVPREDIRRLVAFLAETEGAAIAEVDLAVVPADEMAAMNRRYLRHAGATDVLSFDLSDNTRRGLVVQLVICGEVAAKEAAARGLPVRRELLLYVVHGLLHMMGYEDESIRGAAKMHAREEELLAEFLRRGR